MKGIRWGMLLLFFPQPLLAQRLSDSLQHIKEVVVVAKPYKEVIPVQRLIGEELQRLNSHSVADALRYFSGVQIKDYGGMGGLKTIDVRNMGSHHVGVFYDGIQVGNAQNGVVDLGRFSLDDLDEISLYNGQKSEIFQSAKDFASASSVYLKARRPVFVSGKNTHLLVRYKASTIQLVNPSFRWDQRLNDRLALSVSGEYLQSNGKYRFRYRRLTQTGAVAYDTTAVRHNSDIEAMRLETGLYGWLKDGYWQAKLYYYESDRGLPGAIVKNVWQRGERLGDKNFFVQGTYVKALSPRYKMSWNGKFAYDYTHYLSRDSIQFLGQQVTAKAQYDNRFYQQDWYLSTIHQYAVMPWWDASVSVDFQYNKLNATMKGVATPFSYPERYVAWASLATAMDFGKVKLQANVLGTFVKEKTRQNASAPDRREFSPAIFIGYRPFVSEDLHLRAFYKRIFRLPTFNDMYYTQVGYALLRPEYTDQWNIGMAYTKTFRSGLIDEITLQTDAYMAFITDKIIAAPTGSSFRWMMTNMGKVESKGIDVTASARGHIGKVRLHSRLGYSYTQAQDFTKINGQPLSSYGDQIPYTPWHSGSAVLGADYGSWAVNYSFIYVGERYNGAVNNIPRNHIQPWYTHDLSLQKEFVIARKYTLKASIEVNNLLNQYYDVVLNYPMPGRNCRFIISMSL